VQRRKEPRFIVNKTVSVRVLAAYPGPSLGESVDASIVDFSGNGMRLRLQYSVPCGASVEIMDKNNLIRGTACHCAPQDTAYILGVRILEYILPPLIDTGLH
jgi:hypothetical protein